MKLNLNIKNLVISLCLVPYALCLIAFVPSANAQLVAVEGSTLGGWDGDSSTESFHLIFSDIESGVNNFEIMASGFDNIDDKTPINHPDMFSTGSRLTLLLDYYDSYSDENYILELYDGWPLSIDSDEYGADYKVPYDKEIRVLPSQIEFDEWDWFFFGDDKVKLFSKYYSGSDLNIIKATSGMELDDTVKDLSWKQDIMEESVYIDYKILIPLELRNPDFYAAGGYLSGSSTHAGEKIKYETVLHVQVTPDGITVNPWEEKDSSPPIEDDSNNPTETKTKVTPFEGHGLNQIEEGSFLGISSERDFDKFIVGITNFILSFVAVIAILILVYGGYLWIIDQGDEQNSEKAKKTIAGAIIGILIIISAYTIVNTVITLEGTPDCQFEIGIGGSPTTADCSFEGNAATTAGIGSVVGGILGGNEGTMAGGILGGLLGGG